MQSKSGSQRLFCAVEIPESAKVLIAEASKGFSAHGIAFVQSNNIHLTLLFLGDVANDSIASIRSKLKLVRFNGFDVRLIGFDTFSKTKPGVVFCRVAGGKDELGSLRGKIIAALGDIPISGMDKGGFSAHATIARIRRLDTDSAQNLGAFLDKNKNTELGTFRVSSFVLKSSALTGEGPIYSDVETFNAER
jgi:2'-5' RNA ligase